MTLRGTSAGLWEALATERSAADVAATEQVPGLCRAYQYAALHRLAGQFDGGNILEIGCFHGRSALVMALAAPGARIVTMSPDGEQAAAARLNVAGRNVEVLESTAVDFFVRDRSQWDMVFVDGNHKKVARDVAWFNRLRAGGLMLFHDYTPATARQRPHVEVCAAVDGLARRLGRGLDVLIVDEYEVGMAGVYRREGERW